MNIEWYDHSTKTKIFFVIFLGFAVSLLTGFVYSQYFEKHSAKIIKNTNLLKSEYPSQAYSKSIEDDDQPDTIEQFSENKTVSEKFTFNIITGIIYLLIGLYLKQQYHDVVGYGLMLAGILRLCNNIFY
jgi:hypothetical protein